MEIGVTELSPAAEEVARQLDALMVQDPERGQEVLEHCYYLAFGRPRVLPSEQDGAPCF